MGNNSAAAAAGSPLIQPVLSEWIDYTPQVTWGSVAVLGKWKRDGSDILLKVGLILSGTPSGTLTATVSQLVNGILDNGIQITYAVSANPAGANKMPFGTWSGVDTGVADYQGIVGPSDATIANPLCYLLYNATAAAVVAVSATTPFAWGTGDKIGMLLRIPITQWQGQANQLIGAGYATGSKPGMVQRTPQTNLTVTASGWTTTRAVGVAYSDQNGVWRFNFNICGGFSMATRASGIVSVAGLTFKTGVTAQAITAITVGGVLGMRSYVDGGTSNITCSHGSASTDAYFFSGDVEIDGKPSWA